MPSKTAMKFRWWFKCDNFRLLSSVDESLFVAGIFICRWRRIKEILKTTWRWRRINFHNLHFALIFLTFISFAFARIVRIFAVLIRWRYLFHWNFGWFYLRCALTSEIFGSMTLWFQVVWSCHMRRCIVKFMLFLHLVLLQWRLEHATKRACISLNAESKEATRKQPSTKCGNALTAAINATEK